MVDGRSHPIESSEFPTLFPDVGSGGGKASGVLVFPAVTSDADRYELHLEGTSDNATVGDNGNVRWDIVLHEPGSGQG